MSDNGIALELHQCNLAGLYCCDASIFPTSTGVNPMITVEATAHMLSIGLAEKMHRASVNLKYD